MRSMLICCTIMTLALATPAQAESPVEFPLHQAARAGDLEKVSLLLSGGADVNRRDARGETPLELAALKGNGAVVDILLQSGAGLPPDTVTRQKLLLQACGFGLENLAKRLIAVTNWRIPRNSNGGTLLHAAASGGNPAIISALLRRGMDINRKDRNGWTPLHYAAARGRGTAILVLLRQGAEINPYTIDGHTPLHLARQLGHGVTASLLVRKGATMTPPRFPALEGPWLGQEPPEDAPKIFAPGIVSNHYALHSSVTFSPKGDLVAWRPLAPAGGTLLVSRRVKGQWLAPKPLLPPGAAVEAPLFAPDGRLLYLAPGATGKQRIYQVKLEESGWTSPAPLTGDEAGIHPVWQFSMDRDGHLYFAAEDGLYCSQFIDGRYQPAAKLKISPPSPPACPEISADGGILLFCATAQGSDNLDIFASRRTTSGEWSAPRALPGLVNSAGMDMCPRFSPDGKLLFFTRWHERVHGVYWVSVAVIPGAEAKQ